MIDTHMSKIRDARLGWVSVSVALGLTSTRGKTLTQLATEMGVSKQALSRPTAKLGVTQGTLRLDQTRWFCTEQNFRF
jgi:hypothetical protein